MLKSNWAASLALVVACSAVIGCGGGDNLVTVKGRVVEKGSPINIPDYQEGVNCVRVVFVPLDEGGAIAESLTQSINAKQDGSFEMTGNMGNGIPSGKYRVAIQRMSEGPNGSAEIDPWKGRFGVKASPFVYDVKPDMESLAIDLSAAPKS